MWQVEYYTRRGGRQPVVGWLDDLGHSDIQSRTVISDKITNLSEYGLELLGTEMLKVIVGNDKDFYELRGGKCRIGTYFDRLRNTFVLLHGWRKKAQRENREIEQARSFLREYLREKGG